MANTWKTIYKDNSLRVGPLGVFKSDRKLVDLTEVCRANPAIPSRVDCEEVGVFRKNIGHRVTEAQRRFDAGGLQSRPRVQGGETENANDDWFMTPFAFSRFRRFAGAASNRLGRARRVERRFSVVSVPLWQRDQWPSFGSVVHFAVRKTTAITAYAIANGHAGASFSTASSDVN